MDFLHILNLTKIFEYYYEHNPSFYRTSFFPLLISYLKKTKSPLHSPPPCPTPPHTKSITKSENTWDRREYVTPGSLLKLCTGADKTSCCLKECNSLCEKTEP